MNIGNQTVAVSTVAVAAAAARRIASVAFAVAALAVAAAVLGLGAAGCGPDLIPGSRITHTRVLGARVEAGGDPRRSWPRPGEPVEITWLVVGPGDPRPLAWAAGARPCAAGEDDDRCAERPATIALAGAGAGDTPPKLAFTTPAADTAAATDRLLLTGVICAGGAAGDPDAAAWSRCAPAATDGGGAVDETDIALTVRLQQGDAGNAPPTLTDDPIAIDGAGWTWDTGAVAGSGAGASDGADGSDGAPLVIADGKEHPVTVRADAADREPGEALQLSLFATAGSFDSQFSGVSATDPAPATEMKLLWTPPAAADVPAAGRLVRFVLVLRDLRGGIDWQTRALRLVPPATGGAAAP